MGATCEYDEISLLWLFYVIRQKGDDQGGSILITEVFLKA